MRKLNFIENRKEVVELVADYFAECNLTLQPQKTTDEAFNIVCVVDNDSCLIDYKVFDPLRNCFNGFLYGHGWSNWQMEAREFLSDDDKNEFDSVVECWKNEIEEDVKQEILDSMKTLIREGVSLVTENYNGTNPSAFSEFAETNGFELDDVIEVYNENENELDELWQEYSI